MGRLTDRAAVAELTKVYEQAQKRMLQIIAETEQKGNSTRYQREILTGIQEEIRILDEYVTGWTNGTLPSVFYDSRNQTFEAFRALGGADPARTTGSTTILQNLVANTLSQLTEANHFVGRRVDDALKVAVLESVTGSIALGGDRNMTQALFRQAMSDHAITAITDKNGRRIDLKVYATMIARTTVTEATNAGVMSQLADIDEDLVKMDTTVTCCPICAVYEGRVYSVSGKDKRFPPLKKAFRHGYNNIHPNCTHRLMPYIEEFDRDRLGTLANSNRPFELTPENNAMLERYYADQAQKAARRRSYLQWQQARIDFPEATPKTFAGWQSAKRARSKTYTTVIAKERELKTQVIKTASEATNLDSLAKYFDSKFQVAFEMADLKPLDFIAVKESALGIETVLNHFPKAQDTLKRIGTADGGMMSASSVGDIFYSPKFYQTYEIIKKNTVGTSHWHPYNTDVIANGYHEMGHILESYLIQKDVAEAAANGVTKWSGIMWSNCTIAREIVSEACKDVKKLPGGKDPVTGKPKLNATLKNEISRYATSDDSECLAEAVSDYFTNGEQAAPLSKVIIKELERRIND